MYLADSHALNASFCFQIKHEKKKKDKGKRACEDEDVVKALLFNAFERHQYYNLKDLISITKQPVVRIAYEIQDVQHLGWGGALLSTPYNGLYGEAPPKWGIFFRRQVYGGVGISLAEVTEGVGKSVILIGEKAQKG